MAHHCHATGCTTSVPPKMFMCRAHWYALPARMRAAIWATYREGQEVDKQPSRAYCSAARAAVIQLATAEGREPDTRLYDMYLRETAQEGDQGGQP